MRKTWTILLTLALVWGTAAGCGQKSGKEPSAGLPEESQTLTSAASQDSQETKAADQTEDREWFGTEDGKTVTLRFWGGIQPEYGYDQLVADFNEEYKEKGVQVEYIRYVNDSAGNLQLETYLMGGGEVDMFMNYGKPRLDSRADSNLLLDMSDMLEERGFDLISELGAANAEGYVCDDGSVYGFPTKYENDRWLLINTDMFRAAGVEIPYDGWTYSQFLEAVEKLTHGEGQDKVYGVSYTLKQSNSGVRGIMSSVLGKYYIYGDDSASKVNFDHEVWREGLQMVKTSLDKGWAVPIEDEYSENMTVANTFLAGKCAISTNVSQMRLCMDQENYPHDFVTAVVPAPVPDGAEYQADTYRKHESVEGAGDVFCIAANTGYPKACFEFGMWYVQGGMSPLVRGGRIPLWTGIDRAQIIDVLRESAAGSIDLDSMSNYLSIDNTKGVASVTGSTANEILDVWKEEFEAMCYGRQSVDETVANMVLRGNQLAGR